MGSSRTHPGEVVPARNHYECSQFHVNTSFLKSPHRPGKGVSPTSFATDHPVPNRGMHQMWRIRPKDVKKTEDAVSMCDISVKTPRRSGFGDRDFDSRS